MEPVSIPLSRIATREDWQVRSRLDKGAMARYDAAYRSGVAMAPIWLSPVGEALFVLDGWHRLTAANRAGLTHIDAIVIDTTPEGAAWKAAQANMAHGVPLKKAEYRKVFRALVQSGEYKSGRKNLSYRAISQKLNGMVAHTTVRNWMQEDFPKIASQYGDPEPHGNTGAEPTWTIGNSPLSIALDHLQSLAAIRDALSPDDQQLLDEAMRDRLGADWEEAEVDGGF